MVIATIAPDADERTYQSSRPGHPGSGLCACCGAPTGETEVRRGRWTYAAGHSSTFTVALKVAGDAAYLPGDVPDGQWA